MTLGIYQLIDASLVQQHRFDNISHNLANTTTNAFKKDIFTFDQTFSTITSSAIDFSAGPIIHTGNELDLALENNGFFKVQTPKGIRYTRDGALTLNRDGILSTQNGDALLGESGPIALEGGNVTIDAKGQVYSDGRLIGRISVVEFNDPQQLNKEGRSYYGYVGKEEDIAISEDPGIRQRYIEKSNVEATEEMIRMIETFRTYESVQKAIQSIDEITSKMVNDPGLIQ